jgi:hypothetical protein
LIDKEQAVSEEQIVLRLEVVACHAGSPMGVLLLEALRRYGVATATGVSIAFDDPALQKWWDEQLAGGEVTLETRPLPLPGSGLVEVAAQAQTYSGFFRSDDGHLCFDRSTTKLTEVVAELELATPANSLGRVFTMLQNAGSGFAALWPHPEVIDLTVLEQILSSDDLPRFREAFQGRFHGDGYFSTLGKFLEVCRSRGLL